MMGEEKKLSPLMQAREEVKRLNEVIRQCNTDASNAVIDFNATIREFKNQVGSMESALTTLRNDRTALEAEIKILKDKCSMNGYYQDQNSAMKREIDALQAIFDALDVPKKSNGQYPQDLSIVARAFLWREGIKSKEKEE
jgi:hypothetical protein